MSTLMNKYMMSYGNTHITITCILTLWFTWSTYCLRNLERKFSLSLMANVVNLSKGNTHHIAYADVAITSVGFYKV